MSDASYDSLRAAILAPRPGDGIRDVVRAPRNFLVWLWEAVPVHVPRGDGAAPLSASLFDLPLTRTTSGWGAFLGAALGFVWTMPDLPSALLAAPAGAILGAFCAVTLLVAFAGLVHRTTLLIALAIVIGLGVVTLWFFAPSTPHHHP